MRALRSLLSAHTCKQLSPCNCYTQTAIHIQSPETVRELDWEEKKLLLSTSKEIE